MTEFNIQKLINKQNLEFYDKMEQIESDTMEKLTPEQIEKLNEMERLIDYRMPVRIDERLVEFLDLTHQINERKKELGMK